MSTFMTCVPLLIVMLLLLSFLIVNNRRSRHRLGQWLDSQGYQEASVFEPPIFRPGPFFMLNKRGWGVKKFTVRQSDGSERTGWAMFPAGFFFSQIDEQQYQVKLIWDDEWNSNDVPSWRQ
ncbi:MAG: hypothetical protein KDE53_41145 [Caldilineaceae bacterium]|nr:hypothetical protein [Caldilineaceae bacterium]